MYLKDTRVLTRWGVNHGDDPLYSPIGPEYLLVDNNITPFLLLTVLETLCPLGTVFGVYLIGEPLDDKRQQELQTVLTKVKIDLLGTKVEDIEGSLFTLYIDKEGNIHPSTSNEESISIQDVAIPYKDVWMSKPVLEERWKKLSTLHSDSGKDK